MIFCDIKSNIYKSGLHWRKLFQIFTAAPPVGGKFVYREIKDRNAQFLIPNTFQPFASFFGWPVANVLSVPLPLWLLYPQSIPIQHSSEWEICLGGAA